MPGRSASTGQNLRQRLIPPKASSKSVAAAMRGNRSQDTRPEVLLRSALWKAGTRGYRKHAKSLPGRPDIAFFTQRLAVLIHGCFWHSCPRCGILMPRTHMEYWQEKLRRNKERDAIILEHLRSLGWRPLRLWECQVRDSVQDCLNQVRRALRRSSAGRGSENRA